MMASNNTGIQAMKNAGRYMRSAVSTGVGVQPALQYLRLATIAAVKHGVSREMMDAAYREGRGEK